MDKIYFNKFLVFVLIITLSFLFVLQARAEVIINIIDTAVNALNTVLNTALGITEKIIGSLPGLDFIYKDGECRLENAENAVVHIYSGECDGGGGGGGGVAALQVDLQVNHSQGPVTLTKPANFEMEWTSLNATKCVTQFDWAAGDLPDVNGTLQVSNITQGNYKYGIQCSDADNNTATDFVQIDVVGPQVIMENIGQISVPNPLRVSWSSNYATACAASSAPNIWNGSKALNGSQDIYNPTNASNRGNYSFTMTCTDDNNNSASVTKTADVVVLPDCNFSANPVNIVLPASSTLSWGCSYADSCSINGRGVGTSGSMGVSPSQTTTYNLTCSGLDGSKSWQATVNLGFIPIIKEIIPRL